MSTVLITGANRGIGLELARLYAERGDQVVATAREPDRADALTALAEKTGRVTARALDVTDETSIAALAAATTEPLDMIVMNAGILNAYGGVEDPAHNMAAWRDVLMTNVAGPYLVSKALLPALERGTDKRIAIISSAMGSQAGAPGGAYPYRASKAAATNIARNLAAELRPRGIAVGTYHPGWVRTDMGGQGADISIEESGAGLIARFDTLSMENSGVFENYAGAPVPF